MALLTEGVKFKATKFLLNYPKATGYKSRMIMLDLLSLDFHQQKNNLIFLFKLKNGLYNLDFEKCTRRVQVKPQFGYNLKSSHQDEFSIFVQLYAHGITFPATLKTITRISIFKNVLKKFYFLRLENCSNF